ncbi:MAG: PLP-dependent aminotransferase family protein [Treponema sp.]|jgi:2-aminoadipate transaminase|nr:PLP-dependent aminotransferase family protein [Treponema sp.]
MTYQFTRALTEMTGTATREIFKLLNRPEIVSFAGGLPASGCLPAAHIQEATEAIFSDPAGVKRCLQYGITEGYPELREHILALILDAGIGGMGIDNILITSGGSQALDLTCKVLLNPGDTVLVEDPTFLGFLATVKSYGAQAVGVRAAAGGLDLEDLEAKIRRHRPKLLYVIPNFSNPTGKTYSAENRRALAELALRYETVILEDDPYGRLRFAGEALPAIAHFDACGLAVYCSSFSKTVSPGLRLGFAAGSQEVIRKMGIAKQGADLHSSNLVQMIIKTYLDKGYFYPDIEKSLPRYRERKEAMIRALAKYMPGSFKHTDPDGGLFIWGEFDAPLNTVEIFHEALGRNAAYINGTAFYAENQRAESAGKPVRGLNTLRLNYSNEHPDRIETGIKALGGLFHEKLAALAPPRP